MTVAILFIGEDAVVVGFLQIIVYAGAIMVLFLFVIWLLNLQVETGPTGHLVLKFFGSIGAALLVAELFVDPRTRLICGEVCSSAGGLWLARQPRRQAVHRLPGRLRSDLAAVAGGGSRDRSRSRANCRATRIDPRAAAEQIASIDDPAHLHDVAERDDFCDWRGRRDHTPQHPGDVHVDRADAQRGESRVHRDLAAGSVRWMAR